VGAPIRTSGPTNYDLTCHRDGRSGGWIYADRWQAGGMRKALTRSFWSTTPLFKNFNILCIVLGAGANLQQCIQGPIIKSGAN